MPRPFTAFLLVAVAATAGAQTATGSDYVIRNFKFESGETLPELRIHYAALGKPQRDASGVVRHAVIVCCTEQFRPGS
jgi:homoserine O-acetyltransferase